MNKVALGAGALAFEGLAILEGVDRITGTVPIDDGEADRFDDFGAEVQEDRRGGLEAGNC